MTQWVDYGGQPVTDFASIGTDTMQIPITEGMDVTAAVAELRRCCGRSARIKLFKGDTDADR